MTNLIQVNIPERLINTFLLFSAADYAEAENKFKGFK
ncbi:hypothetical protein SAMN05443550_11629 [Pedobacter hartonius]|uniref:Uncharacterized protein n=1 Tax=Pedobacter hartonius TaxID=425514 RepID=A0A1H4HEB1_9SPHI|nr:hypothetical protein SAMN05443550_11629 [Pedobacter hartonius]